MKTVFITGTSGLLGINLTQELLCADYKVIGLVRNHKRYTGPRHPNLQLIEGGLFDDWTNHLKKCDIVVHAAAETSQNIIDYNGYYSINTNATIQLFNAAIRSRVKQFVFISSANTVGYGSKENPGTENNVIKYPFSGAGYAQSKMEAEEYLLQNKDKILVTIINPTFMLGPHDTKPSSGKLILSALGKKVVFYPEGGKNIVHVQDVAKAIISSFGTAETGEKYLICNENISYRDFFRLLNRIAGQKPLMIKIPRTLLTTMGILGDILRWMRIRTELSANNMKILQTGNYFSNEKSKHELNLEYKSVENTIADTIDYFRTRKTR